MGAAYKNILYCEILFTKIKFGGNEIIFIGGGGEVFQSGNYDRGSIPELLSA